MMDGLCRCSRQSVSVKRLLAASLQFSTSCVSRSSAAEHNYPFAKARAGSFVQEAPRLENSFLGDTFLRRNLERILPKDVLGAAGADFERFGSRVATDIYELGRQCELNPPYLRLQDAWAAPHNKVVTCEAWKQMKNISAEEGLVAAGYPHQRTQYSRLVQMVKNYYFYPSSGLYSCPLAMTDGAAKALEVAGLKDSVAAFTNLTSTDPESFWTSGQWMTEKRGGSDVAGGTETIAVLEEGTEDKYRLYGYKFFSSATDADVALTLARIQDPSTGQVTPGTQGLSLFLLHVDQPSHLHLIRLKQKLGTKQLPTGELLLDGIIAQRISSIGRGVNAISPMLTVTRLHNAVASVSSMRRIISLARDYSRRRVAFGKAIGDHRLHTRTLASMELECRAGVVLFLESCRLLGLDEASMATAADKDLLRLLLPLLKLYTGKQCVGVVSEGIECFGGQGYMEDSGIPVILRDAQVTPIWEGTTNILSLDVLRSIQKSKGGVLRAFMRRVSAIEGRTPAERICSDRLRLSADRLINFCDDARRLDYFARELAFALARTLAGSLLLEHAMWHGASDSDSAAAERLAASLESTMNWIGSNQDSIDVSRDRSLVFDGYDQDNLLSSAS